MRFNLVLVSLLCFITWISSVDATNGPAVSNCCSGWSTTRAPVKKIVNYTIQLDDACAIKAIVFHTEAGGTICSDPNTDWAKKAIREVNKKTGSLQIKEQNEEESTSDITATTVVSTTPKNARRKKGHKKRKRQLRRNIKGWKKCFSGIKSK